MHVESQPWEAVFRSEMDRDCREHALVLRAAGIDHHIARDGPQRLIVVARADAQRARVELDAYSRENRDWPAKANPVQHRTSGIAGALGYAIVLGAVTALRYRHALDLDWYAAGKAHAGLIRDGEWWRAVTALTLHVDLQHLLANLVIGGLVILFACQVLGNGLATLGILITGTMGNLLNAWIRLPDRTSVGASTAVFAALALVAAFVWQRRRSAHRPGLKQWAPLIGGMVLLTFLGAGDERTDVVAHATGFVSGLAVGVLLGRIGDGFLSGVRSQWACGMAAMLTLVAGWSLALIR